MDTEHSQITLKFQKVKQCTVEVVNPNSYSRRTVKSTTSYSRSVINRKKNQTSCHNARLFANHHVDSNRVHRDIDITSQFKGLTGSSILSLMLSPIASLIGSPTASWRTSLIARLIVNPIASLIASLTPSPMASLTSPIIDPFISRVIYEKQLIPIAMTIGRVETRYYKPTDTSRVNERQLIPTGTMETRHYDPTDTRTSAKISDSNPHYGFLSNNSHNNYLKF